MKLPRLHLFELEDQSWFPTLIRDYSTDYLRSMQTYLAVHGKMVSLLNDALVASGERRIVDLCSGGGGPVVDIEGGLRAEGLEVEVVLTDKFPNREAFERARAASGDRIEFVMDSVDAEKVPARLEGLRTLINSFHHFRPAQARAILRDAISKARPIGIFEIPERRIAVLFAVFLIPLVVLLTTPVIRPFRWRRLLFTYVVPLVPFTCLWDGLVSIARAYTVEELRQMVAAEDPTGRFVWVIGTEPIRGPAARLTYAVGHPA